MAETPVAALNVDKPGNSLAAWLALHHPDLFVAMFKQAQAAQLAKKVQLHGLRGLADGTTTSFDSGGDALDYFTPTVQALPSNFVSDSTASGSSWLSSIGSGITSAGSSIGGVLSSAGSSVLGALGSVGSYLTSPQGLNTMIGLGQTYFAVQGATANAQAQQAVLQTQATRTAAGQTVAPITYQNGVPVYATQTAQGVVYQPLSAQGLASLTPSSLTVFFNKYGLWIGAAALAGIGLYVMMRSR